MTAASPGPAPRLCACAHTAARHVAEGCMELDCGCTLPFRDIAQPQPAPGQPTPPGRSFEDMLADPHEQFDLRSELLASIAEYAAAPQASASAYPSPQPAPVTPGQAAYEAMHASRVKRSGDGDSIPWDRLDEFWDGDPGGLHREDMESAAQAATARHVLSGTGALTGDIIALQAERDQLRERLTTQHDAMTQLRAGHAEALAAARYFAETWAELLTSLPDDYRCTMNCAEANAAAGLYRALGDERTAASIIAAHAAHDEDSDQHYTAPEDS